MESFKEMEPKPQNISSGETSKNFGFFTNIPSKLWWFPEICPGILKQIGETRTYLLIKPQIFSQFWWRPLNIWDFPKIERLGTHEKHFRINVSYVTFSF